MTDSMTAAEIAATRHLLGLTRRELGDACGVSEQAVKQWERGSSVAYESRITAILALRDEHDREAAHLIAGARDGIPIGLPDGPRPRGWYLALGARVLDAERDAMIEWE